MVLPGSQIKTLVELLQQRAQERPNQIAYTFLVDGEIEETHVTYAELDRQARAIAAHLQSLAAPGERAMLLYPPGLAFIAGFFGCLYAGLIAVPAYPPHARRPMPRLHAIARNAQPKVALTTQVALSTISSQFADQPDLADICVLSTDTIATHQADSWRTPDIHTDTLAFLQYTSGSTGSAKGVMISHGNILHNEQMMAAALENSEESVGVSWLPVFHDMGLIGNVIQPLYVGARIIHMAPLAFLQQPIRWLRAISRYRATCNAAPNFGYDLCVQMVKPEQCADLDLSSWKVAVAGAEPVRAETLRRFAEHFAPYGFRSEAFYPSYGLAEATLFVAGGFSTEPPVLLQVDKAALEAEQVVRPQPEGGHTLVGCGQSWLGQQIAVVQPQTFTRCPAGQVGEIWVSGPSVAQGYWRQAEDTTETFQAYLADTGEGPFLRTGDLGFLQGDELYVTGRVKDLIIIRGRNHYPQDIEQTVENSHQALQMGGGAAFSVDIQGEERLVIVQELKRTALRNLNIDEVLGNIRQAVAQEHQLQVYATLLLKPGAIPKTSSGKIQRHACRDGFLTNTLAAIN
jgi:acyl-CoA synthetase (AMP-forming)/AMP-acid ligase II